MALTKVKSTNVTFATIDWDAAIKASNFTAESSKGYFVNTTSASVTIALPVGVVGTQITIQDYAGTFATNKVLLDSNGSEKIQGSTSDGQIITKNATSTLVYQDAIRGWTSQDTSIFVPLTVSYLVVAGGGGAGGAGGGGGAGGLKTNLGGTPFNINIATSIGVTVGEGGSGGNGGARALGIVGADSVFSTITSTGGGGGAGFSDNNSATMNGGSGGGGANASGGGNYINGGTGNAAEGKDGGRGFRTASSYNACGGGGGAGTVGADGGGSGSNPIGGAGGTGVASLIGASGSVTYSTGGRGAAEIGSSSPANNAAANSGNGGDQVDNNLMNLTGSDGGSGIIVIRYPNTFSITIPGTLTATTDNSVSGIRITTFTSGTGDVQFALD